MLGERKTLPFWRRRRANLLALERALAPERRAARRTGAERTVIVQKAAQRRFLEANGKVRPAP